MNMPRSEAINPKTINFFAYALWSFPLTYILVLASLYNLPLEKVSKIFFSVYYILHSLLAVGTGVALIKMRPYAWHLFLFQSFLLAVEQIYVAAVMAENYHVGVPLVFALTSILIAILLLKMELRVPYFSPRIAWWESDPRYKISVPVQVSSQDHFHEGEIMDISVGGCFIKTQAPLKIDDSIHVKFSLFEHHFTCLGRIVWRTESAVTHPKGVGVRFLAINKKQNADLKATVKKLRSLSQKIQRQRREEKVLNFERKVENLLADRKQR